MNTTDIVKVPENVMKKRKRDEDWAIKRAEIAL